MGPDSFHVRGGESWPGVLMRFLEAVREWRVVEITGDGVSERRTDRGRHVLFEPVERVFHGSFFVSLQGSMEARVAPGLVNGVMPVMGRDDVPLDGLDEDGEELPEGVPRLVLEGPGERRRSWVCLRVTVDPGTGEAPEDAVEDGTWARVVHVRDLPPRLLDGERPDVDSAGLLPLAEVHWDGTGERAVACRQVVYWDQAWRFEEAEEAEVETALGKHVFRPVK